MLKVTVRATSVLLVSALLGSMLVFGLLRIVGGDVAVVILGENASEENVAALQEKLGLDTPWYQQYWTWISGIPRGDLGQSYALGYNIGPEIGKRLSATLMLTIGSLALAIPLALVFGIYSALHTKQRRGMIVDVGAQIGVAVPGFLVGLLLVLVFAVQLGWLPANGYVRFRDSPSNAFLHMILPVIALATGMIAVFTRYVRSAMLDIINSDYIRTAVSKGQTVNRAIRVHGLRNASIPLVTIGALQLGVLISGAVVIENVFVIPGIGNMLLASVQSREVLVVQSVVFVLLLLVLAINFVMDIAYGFLDPRIRA